MKNASAALKAFIPTTRQFFEADLFTITPGGTQPATPNVSQSIVVDQPSGSQVSWNFVLGTNVQAGSALVLATRETTLTGVTDSQGNTWVKLYNSFWYALNAKAGATTITATYGAANHIQGVAAECRNVANAAPDVSHDLVSGTSTTATSSTITTTAAGDLILAWGSNSTTNAPGYTAGAGYALVTGTNNNCFLEDLLQTTPGSTTATITSGGSIAWSIGIVAFKAGNPPSLRFTSCDRDISWQGNLYSAAGPNFTRSSMKWGLGLTVDTIDMMIDVKPTDLYNGVPILQALATGIFDGARFEVDRLFGLQFGQWIDSVVLFVGNIADITGLGRTRCQLQVRSRLEILNNSLPKNVFQPACRWTLYDAGCTLAKSAFSTSGTLSAGSTALKQLATLAQASGYFDLGTILYTSGANAGIEATVKTYLNGSPSSILLNVSLPNAPATGDAFTIAAGCDHQMATCNTKFSNLIHFGGMPFVPVPETAF